MVKLVGLELFLLMVCDGLGEGERVLCSACVVRLKLRYVLWSGVCVLVCMSSGWEQCVLVSVGGIAC